MSFGYLRKVLAMSCIVLSVKDARGERFDASVDLVKVSTGLQWTAALWANGCLAHIVSGNAARRAEIPRTLQAAIILSDLRVPSELVV
jgi:hypothetical protein